MKAMIFAAGLGSRLKPLTDTRPKALITVGGKTMLEHIILKLKAAGFDEIVINVHHFSNQILAFLEANQNFGIDIQISIRAAVWKEHTTYYIILRICLPKKAKLRMN